MMYFTSYAVIISFTHALNEIYEIFTSSILGENNRNVQNKDMVLRITLGKKITDSASGLNLCVSYECAGSMFHHISLLLLSVERSGS